MNKRFIDFGVRYELVADSPPRLEPADLQQLRNSFQGR